MDRGSKASLRASPTKFTAVTTIIITSPGGIQSQGCFVRTVTDCALFNIFPRLAAGRFGIGTWIYIPGFFFGLGGSGATAWKVYQNIMKHQKKKKRTNERAFNEHF